MIFLIYSAFLLLALNFVIAKKQLTTGSGGQKPVTRREKLAALLVATFPTVVGCATVYWVFGFAALATSSLGLYLIALTCAMVIGWVGSFFIGVVLAFFAGLALFDIDDSG